MNGSWRELLRGIDRRLVTVALLLSVAGVIAVSLALSFGRAAEGDPPYGLMQLRWLLVGAVVFLGAMTVPYRWLVDRAWPIYALAILSLLAVFAIGVAKNNSRRWINLGFMLAQPSELAKIAFILVLANLLRHRRATRRFRGLVMPFVLALLPMGLIIKQPDLGTALVFVPVLFAMLVVGGARARHLALIVAVGMAAALPVYRWGLEDYQRRRVLGFIPMSLRTLGLSEAEKKELRVEAGRTYGYQGEQAVAAIGSGGIVGKLLSDEPRVHVPEARTDFVFTVIAEELGFVGSLGLIGLQVLFLLLMGDIAIRAQEPAGRLLAVGVLALLGAQFLVNVAMTVGLAPITGLPLPFISYGGSSLLASFVAAGLAVNVGMRPGFEFA